MSSEVKEIYSFLQSISGQALPSSANRFAFSMTLGSPLIVVQILENANLIGRFFAMDLTTYQFTGTQTSPAAMQGKLGDYLLGDTSIRL